MDHLVWYDDATFTGNKDDAAPVFLLHGGQVKSTQADTAEDIDIKQT